MLSSPEGAVVDGLVHKLCEGHNDGLTGQVLAHDALRFPLIRSSF